MLILGGLVLWRTRVSFRDDWSGAIEDGPGVALDVERGTLDRTSGGRSTRFVSVTTAVMLAALVPIFLLRGTLTYPIVAVGLGACIGILSTDLIARLITFIWVFQRWEAAHGVRLRLPEVRSPEKAQSRRISRARR